MTRRISALLVVAACGPAHPPALVPQIQPGPAAAAKPHRVLVLEAACGSVEYHCPADFARTVDGIVRGGLEFAGYTVVESESLRLQTRQRHVEQTSSTSGESSHGHSVADEALDQAPTDEAGPACYECRRGHERRC